MIRALPIHEIAFFEERLVADTVEAFVLFLVDVARFFASAPHLLCRHFVMLVGRADKVEFGRKVQFFFQLAEFSGVFIRVGLRVFPAFFRLPEYLQSMLVGARVEKHFIAQERAVSGDNVRLHHFKSEADVGVGVHVRKSRCNVESLLHAAAQYMLSRTFPFGHHAPPSYVLRQFLNGRRYRDREEHAQESGELSAYDKSQNDQERRHADDARHDQRIDEVVLELLDDDVERGREEPQCEPAADKRYRYRGYRGENRTEYGDYLEERGDDS